MLSAAESLAYTIKDKAELSTAWMPFIIGGGLFIPTDKTLDFGSTIQVHVTLVDENASFSFMGKIIWVTPEGAQSHLPAGVGVQLTGEQGDACREKIKHYLQKIKTGGPTHTM